MRCIKCQREIPDNAGFCTNCGQRVPRCPSCNTLLTSRAKFCTKDGTRIPDDILELIPDTTQPPRQKFCTRCGKPCRAGQTVCDACQSQPVPPAKPPKKAKTQKKASKILPAILIILVLLLGLVAGAYFAMDSGLIDTPDWLEGFTSVREPDEDEDDRWDEDEDGDEAEEEDGEDAREEDAPAADAPAAEAPMEIPATEAPVVEAPMEIPATEAPAAAPEVVVPAPTEAPAPAVTYQVGDTVIFGSFEQDNVSANGQEPIEWTVLQVENDRILVISKMLLACIPYHETNVNVTWPDCYARGWLNNTFYDTAFTAGEQSAILHTTDPYGILDDKIFLLSVDEVLKFFPTKSDRICRATKYALSFDPYVNSSTKGSWWLLRTPGSDQKHVASVNSDGVMDYSGGPVASRSGTVRPAMWIRIG